MISERYLNGTYTVETICTGVVVTGKENGIKRIPIREFLEKGYLAELNRRFLHPLGLAMEVVVDDAAEDYRLGGIWDYREDPEGIYFDVKNHPREDMKTKKDFVDTEIEKRRDAREKLFGDIVEPVE